MEPGAQIGVDGSMVQAPSTQIEVKNPSNLDGKNSKKYFLKLKNNLRWWLECIGDSWGV